MTDVLSKVATGEVHSWRARPRISVVTEKTGEGYALMYLSFDSKVMSGSQISDYLNRVVQPKLQQSTASLRPRSSAARSLPCASGSIRTAWRRSA